MTNNQNKIAVAWRNSIRDGGMTYQTAKPPFTGGGSQTVALPMHCPTFSNGRHVSPMVRSAHFDRRAKWAILRDLASTIRQPLSMPI